MEEKQNSKEPEFRISPFLTYAGSFIIFLGMTRLIVFYNAFGITITNYLDFSEIITSFFNVLFVILIFLAYTSIQNFIMSDKEEMERAETKRNAIIKEENYLKIWWLYIKYLKRVLVLGLLTIIGLITSHYFFNGISNWAIFLISSSFFLLISFIVLSTEIERKHVQFNSSINRRRFLYLTLYGLILTFSVVYYSSYQASQIKIKKATLGVRIFLDNDKELVSDSINYYIGQTKNYLFIYHEKNKTTDVYPMTRIKQMTMVNTSSQ
ncbi:MAG: hypothetical protein WDM90_01035 [Ferruginibacter sp.]